MRQSHQQTLELLDGRELSTTGRQTGEQLVYLLLVYMFTLLLSTVLSLLTL